MAKTTRQTVIFGVEDWRRIYQTYREADFQSYDFETLRKSFVDYLRLYYPETFNDYIESSEFIALLDVMAFMGQALAFRTDLNTRENYIDSAERRDSVVRLANLVSYTPKRNIAAQGYLKVFSVQTTENVTDINGIDLANVTVNWADPTNANWQEQFTAIVNAALVDSQRVGVPGARTTILGVDTQEYSINLVPGFLPVVPYTATVDGINMPFEAVTASTLGKTFVYEPSPQPNGVFNVLFRNDQLGFSSANTGYFFLFKQGVLQNQDFNLADRVSNRAVDINIEGINNEDRWLYQLDNVGSIASEWQFVPSVFGAAAEQTAPGLRRLFSTTSRTNDQITLDFGDGVFSAIPVGQFRCYVRASNGLQYIINPEEMQSVVIPISYVSRTGQLETVSFTCGITTPVSNAQPRETIDEIKARAPARYYTQNRMVNGEDYNNFPFTAYNSILKSKALNRASIGTSRYLDLVDNTGKYSSTNTFSSDGALYQNYSLPSFQFTTLTNNEIDEVIVNQVQPLLALSQQQQFYYAKFPRSSLTSLNVSWNLSTSQANTTTGYFKNSLGNPVSIGTFSSNNTRFITVGSLVKFVPPSGFYFDANNRLRAGTPTRADEKLVIWASPLEIFVDGTNQGLGNFTDGLGPVALNNYIPTDAIATQVIPLFVTDLPVSFETSMAEQIRLRRNFGIGYDNLGTVTGTAATWYLITSTNLAVGANWSQIYAGNTTGAGLDASWLVQFVYNGSFYTTSSRALDYYFGSVLQTRFFFTTDQQIYDSRTGTTISDFVNVVKTNSRPDSALPLGSDIITKIIAQPIQTDGLVDDYQVLVSFQDRDNDGVPDNPDFFTDIVGPVPDTATANSPWVFLQQIVDFDDLQRYVLIDSGIVNSTYADLAAIEVDKAEYVAGQIFYAYQTELFYQLTINNTTGVRTLVATTDYLARNGRQNLLFQYRHNSPLTNRIDPGTTNIIDVYVVTNEYYTSYQNYIRDTTGTVAEPAVPTIDYLTTTYGGLQEFKMISDSVILNSVDFQPLFGAKADPTLRATIKVIRAANSVASTSEIKNLVVQNLNNYFSLEVFDFGDTFYFSELAAYLHDNMAGIISSVVLVPLNPSQSFGDLYEIRCAPNQIFVNAATVVNVEVITALTSSNLRTTSPVSGLDALITQNNFGSSTSGSSGGGSGGGPSPYVPPSPGPYSGGGGGGGGY
jgi:hypothetical protein